MDNMSTKDFKRIQQQMQSEEKEAAQIRESISAKRKEISKLEAEIVSLENKLLAYPATSASQSIEENLAAVRERYSSGFNSSTV